MKTKKLMKNVKSILIILLGTLGMAGAVEFFIVPNRLVTGGVAGLGIFLQYFFPEIPLSLFTFIFNVAMLALGLAFLGKRFIVTTLISSLVYPLAMACFEFFYSGDPLTQDPLLAAVASGVLLGVSLGVVIREGASTGGFDIPELIVHKYTGIPVSVLIYAVDFVIIALQLISNSTEAVLYGILLTLVCTVALNKVMVVGNKKTQLKIVSDRSEEIRRAILQDIDRGVTILYGETGYLGKPAKMLVTVMSPREVPQMRALLEKIDPYAFITIEEVNEVRGRGFTLERDSLREEK